MVKTKKLDRREWYADSMRKFECQYHKDDFFEGGIGLITFTGLEEPDVIKTSEGDLCVADNGYQWLELVPKDKHFVLTAMIHDDEIFQQYIDISLKNEIYENGDAVFYDLFLDVVLLKDGTPGIIDTDELEEALSAKVITKEEYELAKRTAEEVLEFYQTSSNRELLKNKIFEYKSLFE